MMCCRCLRALLLLHSRLLLVRVAASITTRPSSHAHNQYYNQYYNTQGRQALLQSLVATRQPPRTRSAPTMLRHLKRVFIQFSPLDPRATSARELLQRVGCDAARKSNPACAVEFSVDEAGAPGSGFVELQFNDDARQRLPTADYRVDDIVRIIEQKASEMELRSVMKEVGFDPRGAAAKKT